MLQSGGINDPTPAVPGKRLLIFFASLALSGFLIFLLRAPILRAAAGLWIINETPVRADAIVIPGGGLQNRPSAAARLYNRGLAPKIVIFRVQPGPCVRQGLTPTEQECTRQLLIAEGVPAEAIVEIGHDVASTRDESHAIRDWANTANPASLLITTDPFHTRRLRWIFERNLKDSDTSLTITTAPRKEYTPDNWWTTESGLIDFQNEIIKSIYYRISD